MAPPLTILGPWRALIDHAGSVTKLATALRVGRRTLHRWLAGGTVPEIAKAGVARWAESRGLVSPWERRGWSAATMRAMAGGDRDFSGDPPS